MRMTKRRGTGGEGMIRGGEPGRVGRNITIKKGPLIRVCGRKRCDETVPKKGGEGYHPKGLLSNA